MGVKVNNNAYGTLSASINSSVTSISLTSGHGARFPAASVASGDYFYATLIDTSNNFEIVKVTDRTSDTLTVVRGRDGTTARAYVAGSRIELRITAALLGDLPNRQLQTTDYADSSVTSAKLAASGVSAGSYGGLGKTLIATVNSKGQLTALSQTSGIVQRNQFDFTTRDNIQAWNKPSAGSLVRIQLWGAGGGGGRAGGGCGGGGGGGASYFEAWYGIDQLASTLSIVVGEGGLGATVNNTSGVNGQPTTVTSGSLVLTAHGGGGGGGDGTTSGAGGGGAGLMTEGGRASGVTPGGSGIFGGGRGGDPNTGDATTTVVTPFTVTTDAVVNTSGQPAGHEWAGGGGGGGNGGAVSGMEAVGGWAVWGGGGGGGGYDGAKTQLGGDGGASLYGGSGGAGNTNSVVGSNGAVPGGGGGGAETANGGDGAHGRCIITVY